jgi:hypothetical protein
MGKKVFPSLLKQGKWYKYKRDAKVGDFVLRKDETAAGQTYKYARIVKCTPGQTGKSGLQTWNIKCPGSQSFV